MASLSYTKEHGSDEEYSGCYIQLYELYFIGKKGSVYQSWKRWVNERAANHAYSILATSFLRAIGILDIGRFISEAPVVWVLEDPGKARKKKDLKVTITSKKTVLKSKDIRVYINIRIQDPIFPGPRFGKGTMWIVTVPSLRENGGMFCFTLLCFALLRFRLHVLLFLPLILTFF